MVGRYRRGCLLGADEGRSHDRFNLLAGQRVNQSERLLLTDLAEPRTRNIGIEQVEHVRRCLSVTDEEQSHACEYGRPATILQPAAGGRSRIIWLESQLDPLREGNASQIAESVRGSWSRLGKGWSPGLYRRRELGRGCIEDEEGE